MFIKLSILFIIIFYIQLSFTQDCVLISNDGTELTEEETAFDIPLPEILDTTKPGTILFELKTKNVIDIVKITHNPINNDKPYMNATLNEENIFKLVLTDNFLNYEEYETKDRMDIRVEFSCNSGITRHIDIVQLITDTNNHKPIFVDAPYSYNLSMPFPKNIPIDLINKISARDIDLTNEKIIFYLNKSDSISDKFNALWLSQDNEDVKLHYARLITTAVLNLKENLTFNLFANDSGSPPQTAVTTVTIFIDKANSILQFTQRIYVADCTNFKPENANGTIISFEQGEISLSGGIDRTIRFTFLEDSGEYQNNFNLKVSSDYTTVQLILIDPPDKFFNESFVLLILTAKKIGVEDTTVIHISLPGRSITNKNLCDDDSNCSCTDCHIIIIVLSILLIGIAIGLITFALIIRRKRNSISKIIKNEDTVQHKHVEITEVSSIEATPVGSSQRSVAFNDTIEEINAVRL